MVRKTPMHHPDPTNVHGVMQAITGIPAGGVVIYMETSGVTTHGPHPIKVELTHPVTLVPPLAPMRKAHNPQGMKENTRIAQSREISR